VRARFPRRQRAVDEVDDTVSRLKQQLQVEGDGEQAEREEPVNIRPEKGEEQMPRQSEESNVHGGVEGTGEEQAKPEGWWLPPHGEDELDLQRENVELRAQLRRLEDELAGHRQRESVIAEALLVAQTAAGELRDRAESESEALRLEAQAEVAELHRQAEQERDTIMKRASADTDELRRRAQSEHAELLAEIERLRTMRSEVEEDLQSLLLRTLKALKGSPADNQGLDQPLADSLQSRVSNAAEASPQAGPATAEI
jgi:cell division septum initiation protein DivIVA